MTETTACDVSLRMPPGSGSGALVAAVIDLCERIDLDLERSERVAAALDAIVVASGERVLHATLRVDKNELHLEITGDPDLGADAFPGEAEGGVFTHMATSAPDGRSGIFATVAGRR